MTIDIEDILAGAMSYVKMHARAAESTLVSAVSLTVALPQRHSPSHSQIDARLLNQQGVLHGHAHLSIQNISGWLLCLGWAGCLLRCVIMLGMKHVDLVCEGELLLSVSTHTWTVFTKAGAFIITAARVKGLRACKSDSYRGRRGTTEKWTTCHTECSQE